MAVNGAQQWSWIWVAIRKQPAELAAEGAEESLLILPDYKPTVRPPPKRC
jgi:hypothetical protein